MTLIRNYLSKSLRSLPEEITQNINVTFYLVLCVPTLFTEVAMETRGTHAASVDVVTQSSIKAYAGVSAAVTIVTWRAFFTKEEEESDTEGDLRCFNAPSGSRVGGVHLLKQPLNKL